MRYINDRGRLQTPLVMNQSKQAVRPGKKRCRPLREDLHQGRRRQDPAGVAAVLSPYLTVEEGYLLARLFKGLSKDCQLFLGWVPTLGEDDHYPKDRKGCNRSGTVKFTIRAEKCPNRRGIEKILEHFQGEVLSFDKALAAADAGNGRRCI